MFIRPRRQDWIFSWRKAAVVTAMLMWSQTSSYGHENPGYYDPTFFNPSSGSQSYGPPGAPPAPYYDPYAAQPGYSPPHNYERIPENPFHDPGYEDPAHDLLKDIVRNSWFRLEYIQWSLKNPGSVRLGADYTDDPSQPFTGSERSSGNPFVGIQPTLDDINLNKQQGIRGTLGVEMNEGTIEWSTWYLAQHTQTQDYASFYNAAQIPPSLNLLDRAIFIPLLLDGVHSNAALPPVLAYDTSFRTRLETSMFGTEANYVWNFNRPNAFWHWRPTAGFRYTNLTEELGMTGVATIPDPHTSTIESKAINNLFGPQAGIRAEMRHEWFTVSFTPTIVLAANRQSSSVKTDNLYSSTSGAFETEDKTYEFSPMFNLAVQGKVHLREHLSFYIGYDLLLIGRVSRPYDNIYYNDDGPGTSPGIVLDQKFSDFMLQGLSLGGEFIF